MIVWMQHLYVSEELWHISYYTHPISFNVKSQHFLWVCNWWLLQCHICMYLSVGIYIHLKNISVLSSILITHIMALYMNILTIFIITLTHHSQWVGTGIPFLKSCLFDSPILGPCFCFISRFSSPWRITHFFHFIKFFPRCGAHAWRYTLSSHFGHCRCCIIFHYNWLSFFLHW